MVAEFAFLQLGAGSRLLNLGALHRTAAVLKAGGLAVLPTETGYMLAAMATSPEAVTKAFRVKGRNRANVMHIACSSLDMAAYVAVLSPMAETLLGALTPGPISVVVPQTDVLPDGLVTLNGTVGLRVPDHPATLQVIAAVGCPVTATSLNAAGQPTTDLYGDEFRQLNWPDPGPVVVVEDAKSVVYDRPSTLVRVTSGSLEILREGPVTLDQMRAALDGRQADCDRSVSDRVADG